MQQRLQVEGGVAAQQKPLRLVSIQRLSVAIQYPAASALHQESSGGNVPALHAVAHPAIHVTLSSSLGDEAHVQCHRATDAKRLLKPALPLHGMEMLPQGIARGIIKDQQGLLQAA